MKNNINSENKNTRRSFIGSLSKLIGGTAVLAGISSLITPKKTFADNDAGLPWVGEITLFGADWAPRNWLPCDGRLLPISNYNSLYSVIGNNFGGDGRTTFALPDLRGRVPIGIEQGPGLPNYSIGSTGGNHETTLQEINIPPHKHHLNVYSEEGDSDTPSNNFIAANPEGMAQFSESFEDTANEFSITTVNSIAQPINNMPPYTALTYCMCVDGAFPSRS